MSMGGSKTQTTEIPQFIEDALRQNIDRGETMSRIGYKPYYGPTVAGMNDLQKGAMRNTSALARGLGMGGAMWNDARQGGIRPTQDFGNGMQGYSSGDMFDQALAEFQRRRPGQYQAYADMFIDPQSGAMSVYDQNRVAQELAAAGLNSSDINAIMAGMGSQDAGAPAHAIDWNELSPEAQRIASLFIPGLNLANGVESLINNIRTFVNDQQAANRSNPNLHSERGFSDDGSTYTTSWGDTRNTSGMSQETRRGLGSLGSNGSLGSGTLDTSGTFDD